MSLAAEPAGGGGRVCTHGGGSLAVQLQVLQCDLRAQLREVQVERAGGLRGPRCTALEHAPQHHCIGDHPGWGESAGRWRGGGTTSQQQFAVLFVCFIFLELV